MLSSTTCTKYYVHTIYVCRYIDLYVLSRHSTRRQQKKKNNNYKYVDISTYRHICMHTHIRTHVPLQNYLTFICRLELCSESSARSSSQSVTNWPPPKPFDSSVVYLRSFNVDMWIGIYIRVRIYFTFNWSILQCHTISAMSIRISYRVEEQ